MTKTELHGKLSGSMHEVVEQLYEDLRKRSVEKEEIMEKILEVDQIYEMNSKLDDRQHNDMRETLNYDCVAYDKYKQKRRIHMHGKDLKEIVHKASVINQCDGNLIGYSDMNVSTMTMMEHMHMTKHMIALNQNEEDTEGILLVNADGVVSTYNNQPFVAVSHSWAPWVTKLTMEKRKRQFSRVPALKEGVGWETADTILDTLNKYTHENWYWFDWLCVDQDDKTLQAYDLTLQRHVYSRANKVVVLLRDDVGAEFWRMAKWLVEEQNEDQLTMIVIKLLQISSNVRWCQSYWTILEVELCDNVEMLSPTGQIVNYKALINKIRTTLTRILGKRPAYILRDVLKELCGEFRYKIYPIENLTMLQREFRFNVELVRGANAMLYILDNVPKGYSFGTTVDEIEENLKEYVTMTGNILPILGVMLRKHNTSVDCLWHHGSNRDGWEPQKPYIGGCMIHTGIFTMIANPLILSASTEKHSHNPLLFLGIVKCGETKQLGLVANIERQRATDYWHVLNIRMIDMSKIYNTKGRRYKQCLIRVGLTTSEATDISIHSIARS